MIIAFVLGSTLAQFAGSKQSPGIDVAETNEGLVDPFCGFELKPV
jgi:hypothetical protein